MMKHLAAFVLALVAFGVATFLLVENVRTLGTAHILLGTIIGLYTFAGTMAAPAQMSQARAQLVAWWTAYKASGATLPPPGGTP